MRCPELPLQAPRGIAHSGLVADAVTPGALTILRS